MDLLTAFGRALNSIPGSHQCIPHVHWLHLLPISYKVVGLQRIIDRLGSGTNVHETDFCIRYLSPIKDLETTYLYQDVTY